MIPTSLAVWIKASAGGQFPRNAWFQLPNLEVYVRVVPGLKRIDIANVLARVRGQGTFTSFLVDMERLADELGFSLYIENVLEPRFADFFRQRGYKEIPSDGPPSFTWRA